MDIRHPATVEAQKEGGFLVTFVDLPDTFTEGHIKDEALFNAAEVLLAMLAWRLGGMKDVPAPLAIAEDSRSRCGGTWQAPGADARVKDSRVVITPVAGRVDFDSG